MCEKRPKLAATGRQFHNIQSNPSFARAKSCLVHPVAGSLANAIDFVCGLGLPHACTKAILEQWHEPLGCSLTAQRMNTPQN